MYEGELQARALGANVEAWNVASRCSTPPISAVENWKIGPRKITFSPILSNSTEFKVSTMAPDTIAPTRAAKIPSRMTLHQLPFDEQVQSVM